MKMVPMQVDLVGHYGSDLTVVNSARVSFHKVSDELTEKDKRLINYLAEHKHHSPFNHAFLSFRVKAPIFVARQLVKHKFMPWNEVSRRYVDDEPEFYFPTQFRLRAESVKQGSSIAEAWWPSFWGYDTNKEDVYENTEDCLRLYTHMIKNEVCPEQARMVLPQNTMTEWYWSGTLGAFLDMLVLRLDSHTQQETREVAQMIAEHVKELFPVAYGAYLDGK